VHADRRPGRFAWALHDDARPEHLVAFTEDRGTDLEGLTDDSLGGQPPAGDHRLHIADRNPSNHVCTLPSTQARHAGAITVDGQELCQRE
jgi:hypothetical protein